MKLWGERTWVYMTNPTCLFAGDLTLGEASCIVTMAGFIGTVNFASPVHPPIGPGSPVASPVQCPRDVINSLSSGDIIPSDIYVSVVLS